MMCGEKTIHYFGRNALREAANKAKAFLGFSAPLKASSDFRPVATELSCPDSGGPAPRNENQFVVGVVSASPGKDDSVITNLQKLTFEFLLALTVRWQYLNLNSGTLWIIRQIQILNLRSHMAGRQCN